VRPLAAILGDLTGPAWAAAGLSAAGWLGLVALAYASPLGGQICRTTAAPPSDMLSSEVPLAWGLMILAMMGPLLSGPIHHLWHRSLARHRLRSIVLFLFGYLAAWWIVCALLFSVPGMAAGYQLDPAVVLILSILLAGLWQFSLAKRYALLRCHMKPPLSIFGARAWLDPVRFGLHLACWCVVSCWALMLASFAVSGGGLAPMMIASAIIVYEQLLRERPQPFGDLRYERSV
jgi:predicted metal-binding membrane protein